ncbi:MAG: hypothetical protein EOO06_21650 [Chitinophagaceae bacterium]|nr:MAG: hypothetical protein EOO06_21650 [Chitinophagaceae bacterium]
MPKGHIKNVSVIKKDAGRSSVERSVATLVAHSDDAPSNNKKEALKKASFKVCNSYKLDGAVAIEIFQLFTHCV